MENTDKSVKHTPPPWHIGMQPGPIIYGPNGEQVADLRGERKTLVVEIDEAVANTKLIASAPELLAALQECVKQCADYERMTDECAAAFRNARAAIAKARGDNHGQ